MYFSSVSGGRISSARSGMWECFFAACLGLLICECSTPAVADQSNGAGPTFVVFNITAQPLASALDAYSLATGLQVVYDGTLALERRSSPVMGSMPPHAALRTLLQGTGLVAVYASNAFTIVPAPAVQRRGRAPLDDFMPYLAAVQGSVEQAFCRTPLTRPGKYWIKFKFRIGSGGEVLQPQLLGATDSVARDQAIEQLLGSLTIDRPPPPDLPQPVVMAISPRAPVETGDCLFDRIRPAGVGAP